MNVCSFTLSPRRSLDTRIPWCVSLSRSMSLTVSCAHGARTRSSAHSALVRARDTRQVTHPLVEVIHPLVAGSWREATLLNHHSSRPRRGRRSGGGRARRGRRMRLSGAVLGGGASGLERAIVPAAHARSPRCELCQGDLAVSEKPVCCAAKVVHVALDASGDIRAAEAEVNHVKD